MIRIISIISLLFFSIASFAEDYDEEIIFNEGAWKVAIWEFDEGGISCAAGLITDEKEFFIEINPEEMLLDKSQLLGLTAPEMTVLLGGMRSLGISHSDYGIISDNPNQLDNDFFTTLLDMRVAWQPNGTGNSYEAKDRVSGEKVRTASRTDLVFGSNSQLRALVEVYAASDSKEKFTNDFIKAWNKVMNNDLFLD